MTKNKLFVKALGKKRNKNKIHRYQTYPVLYAWGYTCKDVNLDVTKINKFCKSLVIYKWNGKELSQESHKVQFLRIN